MQKTAPSSLSNVFAFTSENPQGALCHVDLSVKPNKPGNQTLCVKAKAQRFVKNLNHLTIFLNVFVLFYFIYLGNSGSFQR